MQGGTPLHLVTNNDLFDCFDMKKLTGKGNIKRTYKCADKKSLAKQIFLRYLHIMFTDFLEGGKTFMFPAKKYLELRMRRIPRERYINARKAGHFQDVDILISQQLCWEPVLCYRIRGCLFEVPVKLSDNFRVQMIEKINTGYKYC